MNHIYRIVFNRSQGIFQVVSENASGQGKDSRRLKPAATTPRSSKTKRTPTSIMRRMRGVLAITRHRILILLPITAIVAVVISPAYAQTFTGSATTSGPFSSGIQNFLDSSTLNASTADAVSGGGQYFSDSSTLNASGADAVSGGVQTFYDNSTLNASAANAISGGEQSFWNSSTLNASAANAVRGGLQFFLDSSTLNVSAANAVRGGDQYFSDSSALNASGADAVSGGAQVFLDTSTLNASAADAISGGEQRFRNSSTLNASAANAVRGGNQYFFDISRLNASAANAVSDGVLVFYDSSTLNASASNAVSGGLQSFFDSSTLNASVAGAVRGGQQFFYHTSTLNASAADAVRGGQQFFYYTSRLNASAANAVSGGTQVFLNSSTLNASVGNAISGGGQGFNDSSMLNASAASAVRGGIQVFFDSSTLNASVAGAVSGGVQHFWSSSTLNASAANAVSGGTQNFNDTSTLNASASNAVSGGFQNFSGTSTLNASAADAVSGGTQNFNDTSTLNASASNAVSGGIQNFFSSSALNASAADAVSGGIQGFSSTSTLNASAANAVSGGTQFFNSTSTLNASAANAVSGGTQYFNSTSTLNASVGNAVSGGDQFFNSTSTINASVGNAVSGGDQYFSDTSTLNVLAANALTTGTNIRFNNITGGTGGTLKLNGYDTVIGGINSFKGGSGVITNGAADNSTLIVDTSLVGPSAFSGVIEDGGLGTLGLTLKAGQLTLTGTSTHTGGTTVSGGTLLVGDADGNGTLGGNVWVGATGTLGGSGTLTGAVTVDGSLSAGNSPGTLSFDNDLTLTASSTSVFELNTLGVVGGTGAGGNDLVNVAGNLTLGGTLKAHVAAAGYYRLFDYGTLAFSSAFGSETVTSSIGGFSVTSHEVHYATAGQVNLSVLGAGQALQFWDGSQMAPNGAVNGGDGTWQDLATNWTNDAGSANTVWGGSVGVFAGTAGTVTVDGTQSFDTLQFSTDGYALNGGTLALMPAAGNAGTLNVDSGISATIGSSIADGGAAALSKVGGGTLVLTATNTYTGGTTIAGGVVSVSHDTHLGAASGALTFDRGVLRVTGTGYTTTDRAIMIGAGGGGFDIGEATNRFTLSHDITGTGDLLKQGDGTLVLTGTNAYEGDTLVDAGTLVGDTASIRGRIANAATLVFDQADNAGFAGNIGGFGGASGQMVKRGAGELILAGTSALDWTIEAGSLVSAANRFAGNVEIGRSAALTFDQADDGRYAGMLSGAGRFTKGGDGFLQLSGDSSAFAGTMTITSGTLLVGDGDGNGALGGRLDVLDGATLGGSGTVGSGTGSLVKVASGGTLAPGNSIGTLTINGDLSFGPGSRFAVEVNPQGTDSDRVAVTGNATLHGGSVAHIGANGEYHPRSTYTILTADGTLSGAFDQVTSDFAFLTPELLYDYGAGKVDLELSRNERDFVSAALTRNQSATANGIESIGLEAGNAVYDAIVQLPDDESLIRASFDALSGEIHASTKTALIEDSRFIRNAANDRVRAAFAAPGASSAPVSAYGPGQTPAQVSANHNGAVVWSQAFGSWGETDDDGNAASLDRNTGGLLIGADRLVGDWRVGLLAGYSHSDFKARDRASSGKSDNYHLGVYGGTQWDALGLRTGLAYSWHDIDTKRSIAIPGLSSNPQANYRAGTFQAFGELGYGIELKHVRLEPFANLAHVRLHTDGYSESGGAAALSGRSDNTDTTFTTLGLRAEHGVSVGATEATLRAMVGWRHAFGDTTPEVLHGFSSGDAFTVAGVPIAKDSAVIEAGVDLNLTPSATFGLSYAGQLSGSARDHGVKANLAIKF